MRTTVLGQGTKAQRGPEAGQEWGVKDENGWMQEGQKSSRMQCLQNQSERLREGTFPFLIARVLQPEAGRPRERGNGAGGVKELESQALRGRRG